MMISVQTRVLRLLAVWMAVSALILTTACGKKGGDVKPPPPPPPAQKPADGKGGKPSNPFVSKSPRTGAQPSQPTAPESQASTNGPKRIAPVKPAPSKPGDDLGSSRSQQEQYATGPIEEETPGVMSENPPPMDTDRESDAVAGGVEAPAAMGGAHTHFSSSAPDELHNEIKSLLVRHRTGNLTQQIVFSTFDADFSNPNALRAQITLTLKDRKNRTQTVRLTAPLNNKLHASGKVKVGQRQLTVDAVCMDLKGGCRTVHMRIKDGKGDQAHVITRDTDAKLAISGPGFGRAANPEYDRFFNILQNTAQFPDPAIQNKIQVLRVATSETINGRSEFLIKMGVEHQGGHWEWIAWHGPLAKLRNRSSGLPNGGEPVFAISGAIVLGDGHGTVVQSGGPLTQSLRETKLVRNDGAGTLQLDVVVRKSDRDASEETVRLTFFRKTRPVRSLILR